MHVSENAERRWREFFADPRNSHRKDALSRAMQGVLPVDGDPLRDPLFLPADVAARHESVMEQMETYENSSLPAGFHNHVIKDGDHVYCAAEYKVWQHRTAYDLLSRGDPTHPRKARQNFDLPPEPVVKVSFANGQKRVHYGDSEQLPVQSDKPDS